MAGLDQKTCPGLCCTRFPISTDIIKLAVMARDGDSEAGKIMAMVFPSRWRPGEIKTIFECRYYDRETRSCTNYENRPDMCSRFPYGDACYYCTYDPLKGVDVGVLKPEWESFVDPVFSPHDMLPPAKEP